MPLARDERWGLAIACAIGAAALGLWTYRQVRPRPQPEVAAAAEAPVATQAARDAFAEALEVAFVEDGTDAAVEANGTALEIRWFPCGKVMLERLLRRQRDALTRRVREASGLSIPKLRSLGFEQAVCDNTRGAKAIDDLAPRKRRR